MSHSLLFAHPRVIAWRNRLRGNSLLRGVYASLAGRGDYEARFARELLEAVRAATRYGTLVPNVGSTRLNLPSVALQTLCASSLRRRQLQPCAIVFRRYARANSVQIVPIALADRRGTATFSADGSSPNNQIGASDGTKPTVEIQVRSGMRHWSSLLCHPMSSD